MPRKIGNTAMDDGTSGKAQDNSRVTEIGFQLRQWDRVATQATTNQQVARAELATAKGEIDASISDPTIRAELHQEFVDVDTKIVADIQTYSASVTPIT